jgi:uncharacterized protein (UPF0332 family)
MERKARENLEAARLLLEGEDHCPNSSISRAYYAAYHACWDAMVDAGHPVPEVRRSVRYFHHQTFPQEVCDAGVLDEQQAGDLDYLYNQRIKADYYEDDVTLEEARAALKVSEALVHRLLEEQP